MSGSLILRSCCGRRWKPLPPSLMDHRSSTNAWAWGFAGLIAGGILTVCAMIAAGAGHGTYLPLVLFFGPLAFVPAVAIFAGSPLYGIYAFKLSRSNRRTRIIIVSVTVASQLGLAVWSSFPVDAYWTRAWNSVSGWIVLGTIFYLAIQATAIASCIQTKVTFKEGHCHGCGYDLTGNISGVCSECGETVVIQEVGGPER